MSAIATSIAVTKQTVDANTIRITALDNTDPLHLGSVPRLEQSVTTLDDRLTTLDSTNPDNPGVLVAMENQITYLFERDEVVFDRTRFMRAYTTPSSTNHTSFSNPVEFETIHLDDMVVGTSPPTTVSANALSRIATLNSDAQAQFNAIATSLTDLTTAIARLSPTVYANYRITTADLTGATLQSSSVWYTQDHRCNVNHTLLTAGEYLVIFRGRVSCTTGGLSINEIIRAQSEIEYFDPTITQIHRASGRHGLYITTSTSQREEYTYEITDYYVCPADRYIQVRIRTWTEIKGRTNTEYTGDIRIVRTKNSA